MLKLYQQRVADEYDELWVRRLKLFAFLSTEMFKRLSLDEQKRMTRQYAVMEEYETILKDRIAAFGLMGQDV